MWHTLGIGALALPVLGIALALAGFDRLGSLDMKRAALLISGLGLIVPYLLGTMGRVTAADLNDASSTLGHLVGWLPGLFAVYMPKYVGVAGAVIIGFLALSAVTLVTLAWHPLQRLEKGASSAAAVGAPVAVRRPTGSRRWRSASPAQRRRSSRRWPTTTTSSPRRSRRKPREEGEEAEADVEGDGGEHHR